MSKDYDMPPFLEDLFFGNHRPAAQPPGKSAPHPYTTPLLDRVLERICRYQDTGDMNALRKAQMMLSRIIEEADGKTDRR
jgi:hypothetical protein